MAHIPNVIPPVAPVVRVNAHRIAECVYLGFNIREHTGWICAILAILLVCEIAAFFIRDIEH